MLFKEIVDGRTDGRTHGRRTPDIEGSQKLTEHFVLRWAKNACFLINAVEIAKMFVNYSFFTICLLHMAKCLWWLPFCQNFRNIFGVETYECALAEKTGTKRAILTKNRYKFYMKFILLIDTWHIIFIFLNDCFWCELSEYIWCS